MMRRLLCNDCALRLLPAGVREAAKATKWEPAEIQRLVLGVAKVPTQEQRTVLLNGDPFLMDTTYYECDNCDRRILPGDQCGAWSVWLEGCPEEPAWEWEYMIPST